MSILTIIMITRHTCISLSLYRSVFFLSHHIVLFIIVVLLILLLDGGSSFGASRA